MNTASDLPPIVLQTGNQPRHSIIWLHGLGADGQDFVPVAQELDLPVPVRYIFPHAPMRPVTINGGFVMRAWYDISSADMGDRQDEAGIRASQALLESLIGQEMSSGIEAGNIFLAGFSQGGAIVLHTALRQHIRLGGVLALSTYLPLMDHIRSEMSLQSGAIPIFMAHGRYDPVVPFELGKRSRDALLKLGCRVDWREYPMPHSVCEEELQDVTGWLGSKMGAGSGSEK